MPRDSETTTQFKADISQLKAAMQEASRQVRLANSEFKAATAGMDDWTNSADGLGAKLKQLDTVLKAQYKQLDSLEKQYILTAREQGENSKGAQELMVKINNQRAAIQRTERQIDTYNDALEDMSEEAQEARERTEAYENALNDLEDASNNTSNGFTVMKGALANLVADGIRHAIDEVKELAKETLQVGMSFESAMSQVEAVSGASAEEMDKLTEKAKEMGKNTKFSATESAEAFNYMAMAGWKTEDMINGIEGIMNLAAASGEDLATTSDIVTDALTAMGYSAKDSGKLADVMAAASSNANTNVAMMGQTFQYAAPIVGALGYSMEDTAVAIGLMANAGIKGTQAGTSLRSILSRLSAPPKECATAMEELGMSLTDSEGNMKSLDEVVGDLRTAFDGLSETEQTSMAKHIAGQEAMSGLLAIVNAAPADFNKLTEAVQESEGAAKSMADTMNDNVGGQITLLRSKVEGIMIKIFERASGSIKTAINEVSDTLDNVDGDKVADRVGNAFLKLIDVFKWILKNGSLIKGTISGMIAAFAVGKIATAVSTVIQMVSVTKTLVTAIKSATTAQEVFNAVQAANPMGLVALGVGVLVGGLVTYISKTKEAGKETHSLTEEYSKNIDAINDRAEALRQASEENSKAVSDIQAEYGYYSELVNELDTLIDQNGKVKKGYEDRATFIVGTLNDALGMEISMVDGVISTYKDEKKAIEDVIQAKKNEALLEVYKDDYTNAIKNRTTAYEELTKAQERTTKANAELTKAQDNYTEAEKKLNEAMSGGGIQAVNVYTEKLANAGKELQKAEEQQKAATKSVNEATKSWQSYNSTISNYEGASAAIISGDVQKINTEMAKLTSGFIRAENGNKKSLENQVKNYEQNLDNLKKAIKDGTPSVTQEMVDQAESMVTAAKDELDTFESKANSSALNGVKAFIKGLGSDSETVKTSGENMAKNAKAGADSVDSSASGTNFVSGFVNKLTSNDTATKVWNAGYNIAVNALAALRKGQQEGSPSKLTAQSGVYFGEGYRNGINSMLKPVAKSAGEIGVRAILSLRDAQQEHSPSKLTYQSGVNFTKGYINGIASMQKDIVKTTKTLVTAVTKEMLKLNNFNFSEVSEKANNIFSEEVLAKINYTTDKMMYQNEQNIAKFDKKITDMEKKRDNELIELEKERDKKIKALEEERKKAKTKTQKAQIQNTISATKKAYNAEIKALTKNYNKLIKEQEKFKEAYEKSSSEMIADFTDALSQYQMKAEQLISDTINGITDKYQTRYDELLNKQNALIGKLKGAGELFTVSDAGIMTVNDIKEQTKNIKEYAAKLKTIKGKVSSELFDEIASYDIKEGSAFIDRLLGLSNKELKAYDEAYSEKMSIAESLSKNIYKSDFKNIADEYKKEIKKAFKDLPKQLEDLGTDTMKGFVKGFTKNTDYLSKSVKTLIKGMIDTFKKDLKIHSPSKVTEVLGEYTGEGFGDGLKNMVGYVKKTAGQMVEEAALPLDEFRTSIGNAKNNVATQNGITQGSTNNITNNYNLVQNNTSPKSLSALETYRARRQQLAMVKAVTQSV